MADPKNSSHERGAAFVEAALSISGFLIALFLGFDVMLLAYKTAVTQFVANRAIRDAMVVPVIANQNPNIRLQTIFDGIVDRAGRYGIKFDDPDCVVGGDANQCQDVAICSFGNGTCDTGTTGNRSAGEERDLIKIEIMHHHRMMFGAVVHEIEAFAIGRNEPLAS